MSDTITLLVHYRGKIDENISDGVTFSNKKQIGVFINPSTTLIELQGSILQKAGKYGKKHVKQLFFRISISLRQGYVKFGKYEMLGNDDMRVIFHSQVRFFDLDAMELFARMIDVEGSSSGSALNLYTGMMEGSSNAIPTRQPVTPFVSSPSFAGDGRTFGELAIAMGAAHVVDGALAFMEVRERDPFVEAIGDDGSDLEPAIIGDESDGEEDTIRAGDPVNQSSSQTQ
ncbi:hypothetical protein Ahy_A06g027665 [Arachis hypogaea]|uniref:Uncharacterized protein n=1 Tax=Arachis hypogaea TaxID=3818 RepID=A0A445CPE2_ARAHY|nr:hypothetical protein Ahy_A06g027665 [Arachis hypogaea]